MTAQSTAPHPRRLDLRNDFAELERVNEFARQIGEAENLDADQIFALDLCLEEAVTNIIMHAGLKGCVGTPISVTLVVGAPELAFCIEDEGRPFDPTKVAERPAPTSLEDATIGGVGLPLLRKLATAMRYERVGNRNRLFLQFGPGAMHP
ncbi:MAG TPA: ATP-binding protein, partial [Methylovirgula sp.]